MSTATTERLLTGHEVAEIIGRHSQTVSIYARTGRIRSIKIGPHYRFKRAFVDEFLASNETPAPVPKRTAKPSRNPRYSK